MKNQTGRVTRPSFVIFSAAQNIERAIDLFQQHDTRQMVRKGHGRHGQPQCRLAFECLVQPARAADEEAQLGDAVCGHITDLIGKRLTSKEVAA